MLQISSLVIRVILINLMKNYRHTNKYHFYHPLKRYHVVTKRAIFNHLFKRELKQINKQNYHLELQISLHFHNINQKIHLFTVFQVLL